MTALSVLPRLFQIKSDVTDIRRRGQLLQILVLFIAPISAAFVLAALPTAQTAIQAASFLLLVLLMGLISIICLYLITIGRLRVAAHTFFISFNLIHFVLFARDTGVHTSPYFLLVSVVAIAALDTVYASAVYGAVLVAAVTLYVQMASQYAALTSSHGTGFAIVYFLTTLGVGLTTWVFANDLQKALSESRRMAQNLQINADLLQANTNLVQKRARQLQLSAEIGQMTSASLNLDDLLRDTVNLIWDHFAFYHVSLFLLDRKKQFLVLREASGETGQALKAEKYQIALSSTSIIAWVARHQTARITPDVTQDPVYMILPLLQETRSEMALPLMARGQLLGVLDVQSTTPNAFQEEDITILQILANQIAVNIDNARLFAQTEAQLNETEAVYQLITRLTTTLDVGEIYRRAARTFVEQLDVYDCAISSWEPEANTVTTQVAVMIDPMTGTVGEYNTDRSVYHLAAHPGTSHLLQTDEAPRYMLRFVDDPDLEESEREIMLDGEFATCLEIPLVRGTEAIGIVELFRTSSQPPFTAREIQLAQTMANQTAVALHNATLASEAHAQVAQLRTLNRISTILSLAPTQKDVFEGARREILSLIEATGMSIFLLTPEGDKLNWIYGFEYGRDVDLTAIPPLPVSRGFSGRVVQTREVIHINKDIDRLHQELGSTTVGALSQSWLGLPLIVANKLIGVLSVENEHDSNAFQERDIELLKTIAGPLAIAINNLIQFETVQAALVAQSEQRLQLQTAAEVAAAAASILDENELITKAVTLIKERFLLYYVGLFLIDTATHHAVLRAGTGQAGQEQLQRGHRLPVGGRSLIGGATADGVARITQDVTQDHEWRPNPSLPHTRSELALPLRVRGHIIGALTVQSTLAHTFTPELISTLQTMSDQLAIAIENAHLLAQAQARAQYQHDLNQISARLHRSVDVNEIVNIGLRALSERLAGAKVELKLGELSHQADRDGF